VVHPETTDLSVRLADVDDLRPVGQLLYDFNREFDDPAPPPDHLAERMRQLIDAGETTVLLVGPGPDGVAVLRFRPAIWSDALECYLAELYVVPARRGKGLGRALLEAALQHAKDRGADRMDLGTSEDDVAARALYTSLGFRNREGGADGPVTYFYELELPG
jgi:ribosomal protein S18 acetylase RimI-like enzyme